MTQAHFVRCGDGENGRLDWKLMRTSLTIFEHVRAWSSQSCRHYYSFLGFKSHEKFVLCVVDKVSCEMGVSVLRCC